MLYMHDVWVNWFEGEENGYDVCGFYEWRTSDGIELLDSVPLLHITEDLFGYIENGMGDLPEQLLQDIHKRSYTRQEQNRNVINYACVITDGSRIIAIDTNDDKIPTKKSRLIPRQEGLVFDMVKGYDKQSFGFNNTNDEKRHHLLNLHPKFVMGLTRRERRLQKILMMALHNFCEKSVEELRYWLTEWTPEEYELIKYMDRDEALSNLIDELQNGWSKKHEDIGFKIVKSKSYLELMWKEEQNEKVIK